MMEPTEIDNSDFLRALLEGNRGECSRIVHAHLNNQMTVHDLYQKVIVACVENEYHQIGIKMVSDIFELNGWNSFFLGANTPTNELISCVEYVKPDLLAISLSIYSNIPVFEKMIQKIGEQKPNFPILVGGQAFRRGRHDVIARYPNVYYLPDLNGFDAYINNFQLNG